MGALRVDYLLGCRHWLLPIALVRFGLFQWPFYIYYVLFRVVSNVELGRVLVIGLLGIITTLHHGDWLRWPWECLVHLWFLGLAVPLIVGLRLD